jgi:transcriptional regulator with XRE-family HTH domain
MNVAETPQRQPSAADAVRLAVKDHRTARGWTLEILESRMAEVGHPMGITTLSKVERGNRSVSVDDLAAFARAFSVSPEDLLLVGAGSPEVGRVQEALRAWRIGMDRFATAMDALRVANDEYEFAEAHQEDTAQGLRFAVSLALDQLSIPNLLNYVRLRFSPEDAAVVEEIIAAGVHLGSRADQ